MPPMATKYAAEITETLAALKEDGGPIRFTAKNAARVYDEDTGTWSGGGDVVADSFAMQLEDDPALYAKYAAGGLTLRNPITLMVAAGTIPFRLEPQYQATPSVPFPCRSRSNGRLARATSGRSRLSRRSRPTARRSTTP
jgi:hypothetical protein